MLEKSDDVLFSNDNIGLDDIDSDIATFFSDSIGLNIIDLNNFNVDDDSFNEDSPETITHVRLMA